MSFRGTQSTPNRYRSKKTGRFGGRLAAQLDVTWLYVTAYLYSPQGWRRGELALGTAGHRRPSAQRTETGWVPELHDDLSFGAEPL